MKGLTLWRVVIMVDGGGNSAGCSGGHDPCGRTAAMAEARTKAAAEGRTAAEAAGRRLQRKGREIPTTSTATKAATDTRGDGAVYNQRYAGDGRNDSEGWTKGWWMDNG